jgi:SAM-dependent methyltransferase
VSPAHPEQGYSGVDNLEVMSEAENYNRYLLALVRRHAPQGRRVLDFGAGGGQFAVPLAQLGLDVTALEPDDGLRARITGRGVAAVAEPEQLTDRHFGYIYTLNVLEHIPDDVAALRQLHAKLAPGGTLLVYVPAFPLLYTGMDARVGHVRRYTRSSLTAAVSAAGFAIDRCAYVDSLGFFATLLFKAIGDSSGNINRTALRLYDRTVFPLSRIVDTVAQRWFGKNLLLIAHSEAACRTTTPHFSNT